MSSIEMFVGALVALIVIAPIWIASRSRKKLPTTNPEHRIW